jgi:hypothetical protein
MVYRKSKLDFEAKFKVLTHNLSRNGIIEGALGK